MKERMLRRVGLIWLMGFASSCAVSHSMTQEPVGECATRVRTLGGSAPISWILSVAPGDRRLADGWCRTVGPPALDTMPDRSFPEWRDGDSLAVVTWNIKAGSGELLRFLEQELHLDCEASPPAPRRRFSHFVMLAQEAFRRSADVPVVPPQPIVPPRLGEYPRSGPRLDLVEVADRCGLAFAYVPSMRNGHESYGGEREDWGNAILSTLPLGDVVAIELPFEVSRRVAVAASIRGVGGDSLRTVSVHLATFAGPWRTLSTGNASRVRQALGLVDALQLVEGLRSESDSRAVVGCAAPCLPGPEQAAAIATVVGGDLNAWSVDETALQHLRRHFPDSPRDDGATRGPFPTDHLLWRARAGGGFKLVPGSYRTVNDAYNSDHRGRLIWLRVGPAS